MNFSKEDTKVIKGTAIILMLYHHLFSFPDRIGENITYISLFNIAGMPTAYWIGVFGKMCVAIFMFLAGFGTRISFKDSNSNQLSQGIITKLFHLYKTYWQVFFIVIPISILLKVERVTPDISSLVWNFTGLNITYNGEWWFFTPYIICILLYPAIRKMINRKNACLPSDLFYIVLIHGFIFTIVPHIVEYPVFTDFSKTLLWAKLYNALKLLPVFMIGALFANYNVLSKIKCIYGKKILTTIISIISLCIIFYMRKETGEIYDHIYAPLFIIALTLLLQTPLKIVSVIYQLLQKIGSESTVIWLTHSFFCYHWCQKIIFAPKYSILIVIWLLLINYLFAKAIKIFWSFIENHILKANNSHS